MSDNPYTALAWLEEVRTYLPRGPSGTVPAAMALALRMRNEELIAWPSLRQLEFDTQMSRRPLQRGLQFLCSALLLERAERIGTSAVYIAKWPGELTVVSGQPYIPSGRGVSVRLPQMGGVRTSGGGGCVPGTHPPPSRGVTETHPLCPTDALTLKELLRVRKSNAGTRWHKGDEVVNGPKLLKAALRH